jgi:hypothetical protein
LHWQYETEWKGGIVNALFVGMGIAVFDRLADGSGIDSMSLNLDTVFSVWARLAGRGK